jgi:membrane protein insertase Oxa1/YidC/SpoIIIJ
MFKVFEYVHEFAPWWGTIAVATLIARVLMFPLAIYSQSKYIITDPVRPVIVSMLKCTGNTARMSHVMPEMQEAQQRFQKARRIGNQADSEFS